MIGRLLVFFLTIAAWASAPPYIFKYYATSFPFAEFVLDGSTLVLGRSYSFFLIKKSGVPFWNADRYTVSLRCYGVIGDSKTGVVVSAEGLNLDSGSKRSFTVNANDCPDANCQFKCESALTCNEEYATENVGGAPCHSYRSDCKSKFPSTPGPQCDVNSEGIRDSTLKTENCNCGDLGLLGLCTKERKVCLEITYTVPVFAEFSLIPGSTVTPSPTPSPSSSDSPTTPWPTAAPTDMQTFAPTSAPTGLLCLGDFMQWNGFSHGGWSWSQKVPSVEVVNNGTGLIVSRTLFSSGTTVLVPRAVDSLVLSFDYTFGPGTLPLHIIGIEITADNSLSRSVRLTNITGYTQGQLQLNATDLVTNTGMSVDIIIRAIAFPDRSQDIYFLASFLSLTAVCSSATPAPPPLCLENEQTFFNDWTELDMNEQSLPLIPVHSGLIPNDQQMDLSIEWRKVGPKPVGATDGNRFIVFVLAVNQQSGVIYGNTTIISDAITNRDSMLSFARMRPALRSTSGVDALSVHIRLQGTLTVAVRNLSIRFYCAQTPDPERTFSPTAAPSAAPSSSPTSAAPSLSPTFAPTDRVPTAVPSLPPSAPPTPPKIVFTSSPTPVVSTRAPTLSSHASTTSPLSSLGSSTFERNGEDVILFSPPHSPATAAGAVAAAVVISLTVVVSVLLIVLRRRNTRRTATASREQAATGNFSPRKSNRNAVPYDDVVLRPFDGKQHYDEMDPDRSLSKQKRHYDDVDPDRSLSKQRRHYDDIDADRSLSKQRRRKPEEYDEVELNRADAEYDEVSLKHAEYNQAPNQFRLASGRRTTSSRRGRPPQTETDYDTVSLKPANEPGFSYDNIPAELLSRGRNRPSHRYDGIPRELLTRKPSLRSFHRSSTRQASRRL